MKKFGGIHMARNRSFKFECLADNGSCNVTVTSPDGRSISKDVPWTGPEAEETSDADNAAVHAAVKETVEALFAPIAEEATDQRQQEESGP